MITPLDFLSLETWILVISALVLIRLYIHQQWQVFKNCNIPHKSPSILGLGSMGGFLKNLDKFFKEDLFWKNELGYVYGTYMWLQPRIVISDPNILKQVFIKEASTFRDRQVILSTVNGKEMNTMLTAASGDQWKRIRNTLSPTFSTSKLKEMIGIMEKCTDKMVDSLNKICKEDNGRFETKDVFGKLSMDTLCAAAFSANVHAQDDDSKLLKKSKSFFQGSLFKNPLILVFMLSPTMELLASKINYSIFPKAIVNFYKQLIDVLIRNKANTDEKVRVDIMQQMLKNEISEGDVKAGATKGLTRTEIIGNSILMIIAGYETTANTLILFAYCLATSKEVQKKLREEIEDAIENHGALTYDAINNMKYLDMCFKESQRLYPPVPRNSRHADKDITINGIHIPAGAHVDVPLYGMFHDEEYWDEPFEYKPERFADMSKIDPIIFQPFGAGPRNCIGQRFAIIEVKMAICKLIQHFYLDVCDDTAAPPLELVFKGSMQPEKPVFLKVTPCLA